LNALPSGLTDSAFLGKPDFGPALAAAQRAAGGQHYPAASLYVVATPIGNLADITLRALHVLTLVDAIACEDTRHTGQLLRALGIDGKPLIALHEHNEAAAAQTVVERLQRGERVACVSDAGTPAISDPGARLVAACAAAGLRVLPLPGASSVTTALSAAGLTGDGAFVFRGFLPAKGAERAAAIDALAGEARAVVLLEAPHRMRTLAQGLAALAERRVTVARELTKQFEQITTLPCAELPAWLALDAQRERGEFVLVLHPMASTPSANEAGRTLELLLAELPLKTAVRLAAELTGAPRKALYQAALARKKDGAALGAQAAPQRKKL